MVPVVQTEAAASASASAAGQERHCGVGIARECIANIYLIAPERQENPPFSVDGSGMGYMYIRRVKLSSGMRAGFLCPVECAGAGGWMAKCSRCTPCQH